MREINTGFETSHRQKALNNPIKNIKKLLEVQERRGTWLANKCGVTPQLVHYWLTEKYHIKKKYREPIARAFQVPVSMIWEDEES